MALQNGHTGGTRQGTWEALGPVQVGMMVATGLVEELAGETQRGPSRQKQGFAFVLLLIMG